MKTAYQTDKFELHELGQRYLNSASDNTKLKLFIYLKTRKLQSKFVKNEPDEPGQQDPNLRQHEVNQ